MNEKLRNHVNILFAAAPKNAKAEEIKEELLTNLNDKYNDLLANGYDQAAAFHIALSGIGNMEELFKECGAASAAAHRSDGGGMARPDTTKPAAIAPPPVFIKPQPSRIPLYLGIAFGLIAASPLFTWFFSSHGMTTGLGIFYATLCWVVAGVLFLCAIVSFFSRSSRQDEEQYLRQMLLHAEQQGFSKEFLQSELRRIRLNKRRRAGLVLVILLLIFCFVPGVNFLGRGVNGVFDGFNQVVNSVINSGIEPTGQIIKQEREIDGFIFINVSSAIHVDFFLSDKNLVVVETHEDMMPFIKTEVLEGRSLNISQTSHRFRNVKKLHVSVYSQNMPQAFFVSGASRLTTHGPIITESMMLDASGAGNIHIKNLESRRAIFQISGASKIDIAGKAESVSIHANGASKLHASNFEVDRCNADISGASKVEMGTIDKELSIQATGASKFSYGGSPTITKQDVSGASKVNGIGNANKIRAPGVRIDDSGIRLPGVRIDDNGIRLPGVRIDDNGIRIYNSITPHAPVGFVFLILLCWALVIGLIVYAIVRSTSSGKDETFTAPWESATPSMVTVPALASVNKEDISFKRVVAGVLAILLGSLGIHKFYLGFVGTGLIMLLLTVFSCWILSPITGTIGLIEGILYLLKSDRDFYRDYEVRRRNWF